MYFLAQVFSCFSSPRLPAVPAPEAAWFSPDEQHKRLYLPIAARVSAASSLIFDVAQLVSQYASDSMISKGIFMISAAVLKNSSPFVLR